MTKLPHCVDLRDHNWTYLRTEHDPVTGEAVYVLCSRCASVVKRTVVAS